MAVIPIKAHSPKFKQSFLDNLRTWEFASGVAIHLIKQVE